MKAKRKRKMTAEGRRRISLAMKRRWAKHRKAKAGGNGRRRRKAGAASNRNPYLRMTVAELVAARRDLMDAWAVARKLVK